MMQYHSESLSEEFKAWLDIRSKHGKSKIAKGCIALRNHNGGRLLIGIDQNGKIEPKHIDAIKADGYIAENIQAIINEFASDKFEITLNYPATGDELYFVEIIVPSGVTTPSICKADLEDGKMKFLEKNALYIRTYGTNNYPSSAKIQYRDWSDFLNVLFENREMDYAAILKKCFYGKPDNVKILSESQSGINIDTHISSFKTRALEQIKNAGIDISNLGTWEIFAKLEYDNKDYFCGKDEYIELLMNHPKYSGWPTWIIFDTIELKPKFIENSWRYFGNFTKETLYKTIDYWEIAGGNEFYLFRVLETDLQTKDKIFDPLENIARNIEAILTVKKLSATYCKDVAISFCIRYSDIENHNLVTRGLRPFAQPKISYTNKSQFSFTLNPDDDNEAMIEKFKSGMRKTISLFQGAEISDEQYARMLKDVLNRNV